MLLYETSATIRRPLDEVFAVTSNFDIYPTWFPGVERFTPVDALPPETVGKTYREVAKALGRETIITTEVVAYEPGRRVAVHADLKPALPAVEILFSPVDAESTRVLWRMSARNTSLWFRLTGRPLMRAVMRRRADQAMQNLTRLLESRDA